MVEALTLEISNHNRGIGMTGEGEVRELESGGQTWSKKGKGTKAGFGGGGGPSESGRGEWQLRLE